jgi:glyoxylase-like metal-dependent hydrolase (beta-lactamase superfamily II)
MEKGVIGQGVLKIPDLGFSNAYLVEVNPGTLFLIDTGTSSGAEKILAYLKQMGKDPSAISHIILTHADADHSGSAAELRRISKAKLAIHELDAPRISGKKKLKEVGGLGGPVFGLLGGLMKVERVEPDIILKDGDVIGPLNVVHTPGHTDGSICIYKPGTALFVGDILRTDGSGGLKLASSFMSRDMQEVKKSVEKVSKLDFSMLLPGHGEPIVEKASEKLRKFVADGFK